MAVFEKYLPLLQAIEGGYQQLSTDRGNYNSKGENVGTNYGISARFYERVIGRIPSIDDMKRITKEEARGLFKKHFWNRQNANSIRDQSIANTIIDHQINAGNGARLAQKTLQELGYKLSADNKIGPVTLKALNSVKRVAFLSRFNKKREDHYLAQNQPEFIKGWLNRLKLFAVEHKRSISITSMLLLLLVVGGVFYYNNK